VSRLLAWAIGIVTLLASGTYMFVYLYNWEWRRATFMAMVFVAVEVALIGALVLRRLAAIDRRLDDLALGEGASSAAREHLESSRPTRRPFAWLNPTGGQNNVFITLLIGGGIVVSGLAWLVDRIAQHTTVPVLERRLARRMAPLMLPPASLVPRDDDLVARGGDGEGDAVGLLLGPGR
jgi:hypothetical protein